MNTNLKKNSISLALSLVLFPFAAASASEFAGSYVGANLGKDRTTLTGSQDKTVDYPGLVGGHNWDKDGLVLGINGFGDFHRNAYTGRDYGIDGKLGLPNGHWMPYAKLGWAGTAPGDRVHGGLGVEYKFAPNWSVAGEWTTDKRSENGLDYKNKNLSIGVNYYFNAPKAAPVIAAAAPAVVKREPEPVKAPEPAYVAPPPPPPVAKPAPAPAPAPKPKESWKIIKEEKPVTITGANFDTDSAKLKKTADEKLQPVVSFASKYPDADLEVTGHTDSTASDAHNQKLSEARAASVKAWLVEHGVSANRISAKGMGEKQPIADNKTKEGRAQNRRVEIHYTVREEKKVRVME